VAHFISVDTVLLFVLENVEIAVRSVNRRHNAVMKLETISSHIFHLSFTLSFVCLLHSPHRLVPAHKGPFQFLTFSAKEGKKDKREKAVETDKPTDELASKNVFTSLGFQESCEGEENETVWLLCY
jgi:hypothetical protein